MRIIKIAVFVFLAAAAAALSPIAFADGEQCNINTPVGRTWLATGTVTRVDGPVFYLLGKDDVIYKIDSQSSEVMIGDSQADHYVPKVGETVRVYGTVGDGCKIDAARLRIFTGEEETSVASSAGAGPEKEVKIIIEKNPLVVDTRSTCPPPCEAEWQGRGLITDVDYGAGRIKIQTPSGHYTINVQNVAMTYGATIIGMGRLNPGDAVKISGNVVGLNEIDATSVRITRTRSEAENAVPLTPVSVAGVIEQVDYPSFTFKMRTESSPIVVSVDYDTVVQQQMLRMAFMDLKPGMRIKMSGYGSLATGYAAQHIQIISVSP
ncbi:MAG: hypothetical protein ABFD49_04385 [Armatimonadota bacterium]|nr:DUF5666 domain-containing protein [bacterium]